MRGCWLAIEYILRQTLSPLYYAYNCTCLLQLLLLFFSNFWLNSNYLQCRPARGVQGKQEHFVILLYSMDLCFYFTWQEEEQKIKRAALGFDLSFFHFKCPETLTLFRLWYSDFQHFLFQVSLLIIMIKRRCHWEKDESQLCMLPDPPLEWIFSNTRSCWIWSAGRLIDAVIDLKLISVRTVIARAEVITQLSWLALHMVRW